MADLKVDDVLLVVVDGQLVRDAIQGARRLQHGGGVAETFEILLKGAKGVAEQRVAQLVHSVGRQHHALLLGQVNQCLQPGQSMSMRGDCAMVVT